MERFLNIINGYKPLAFLVKPLIVELDCKMTTVKLYKRNSHDVVTCSLFQIYILNLGYI